MGYDDWTGPELDAVAKAIDAVDFDRVFVMDGSTLGFRHVSPDNVLAPEVVCDDEHDILIDGVPLARSEWSAITGMTGQHGYAGAVMHPSEYIGRAIASHMSYLSEDEPMTFVVCEVRDDDGCTPVGWCVLYRDNVAPDFRCLFPVNV